MFILYPVEGLGNRLRAIDSALRYCDVARVRYSVRWYRDARLMNCRWVDLFEQKKWFREAGKGYSVLQWVYKLRRHSALFRRLLSVLKKFRLLVICGPDDWGELRAVTASGKRYLWIIAETFSIFYWPEGDGFRRGEFVLNPEMRRRLESETERFEGGTVGVHIRRTDNRDSIQESPVEMFEAEISRGIAEGFKYYICSDDADVKWSFLKKFGADNIIVPSGPLGRNTVEGVRQAAVELFALARTRYIVGSWFSSFSEMASYLGGIELKIIRK